MSRKHPADPDDFLPADDQSTADGAMEGALDLDTEQAIDQLASGSSADDQRLAEAERQVLLAQAELENFRHRMKRDTDQQLKYANLPLVRDLLDVIDNLNRATESAGQDLATQDPQREQALLAGVKLVLRQFEGVLTKYGCKPIQTLGQPFDPNFHEAISQVASPEHPAGTVAHEVAVGYTLHDRVVRPSSVIVSKGS